MINTVFKDTSGRFEWIDVVNPSHDDYDELTQKYTLHPAAVKDCLSPSHLPKYEEFGSTAFMITRVYDEDATENADSIQELTNKIALFVSDEFVITIHRRAEPFLTRLISKWKNFDQIENYSPSYCINQILYKIIHTFDPVITKSQDTLDKQEREIFLGTKDRNLIWGMYLVKRRASVFKRLLFLTKDTIDRFAKFANVSDPFTHDLVENAESLLFVADELHENVNNLLNLHLSLSSHRTNEVMSILTIFSIFFLPPTFIVGWYGMNFHYMPETESEIGYPVIIFIMLLISVSSYLWFKKKNWL